MPKRDDYSETELQKQRNSRQGYSTATDAGMPGLLEAARAKRAAGEKKYTPAAPPQAEPPTTEQSSPPAPQIKRRK